MFMGKMTQNSMSQLCRPATSYSCLCGFLTPDFNSKWFMDLNIKTEIIKLLEENVGESLHHLKVSKDFTDIKQNILNSKEKVFIFVKTHQIVHIKILCILL